MRDPILQCLECGADGIAAHQRKAQGIAFGNDKAQLRCSTVGKQRVCDDRRCIDDCRAAGAHAGDDQRPLGAVQCPSDPVRERASFTRQPGHGGGRAVQSGRSGKAQPRQFIGRAAIHFGCNFVEPGAAGRGDEQMPFCFAHRLAYGSVVPLGDAELFRSLYRLAAHRLPQSESRYRRCVRQVFSQNEDGVRQLYFVERRRAGGAAAQCFNDGGDQMPL